MKLNLPQEVWMMDGQTYTRSHKEYIICWT